LLAQPASREADRRNNSSAGSDDPTSCGADDARKKLNEVCFNDDPELNPSTKRRLYVECGHEPHLPSASVAAAASPKSWLRLLLQPTDSVV